MSTSIPTAPLPTSTTTTAAAVTSATSSSISLLHRRRRHHLNSLSILAFPLSSNYSNLCLISKSTQPIFTRNVVAKAQLHNAGIDASSSGAAQSKPEVPAKEVKNGKPSSESVPSTLASEESISEFITQVASLVKLVDSRDIVELQMKQHDVELLIRKKEAIQQASPPLPPPPVHVSPPQASPPVSTTVAPSPPPRTTSLAPIPPAPKPPKSSLPPLKSPMSGTFYRSSAPGAPPFVKVGDKVQKGQVVCIIEAMKLMNEIEADQAGTIVEIVAEDGKPVSLDSPLFVIQP